MVAPLLHRLHSSRFIAALILLWASTSVVDAQNRHLDIDPPIVDLVTLRSEELLQEPGDLWDLIEVQPGEPLNRQQITSTVLNFHALGIAGPIEVYVAPSSGGVEVTVVLWATDRVREVQLVGNLGLKRAKLEKVLLQRSAEPLLEDRIVRGLFRLQDLYAEEGYLNHEVRLEMREVPGRKQQDVIYRVDGGLPFEVGEVEFEGDLRGISPADLRERLKAKTGDRYRRELIRDDTERLEQELLKRDFRLASVQEPRETIDHASNQVHLVYPLSLGPSFEIHISGADVKELGNKDLLPFYAKERYDIALVLQAVELIKRHYQEKGHYWVELDWNEQRTEDLLRLDLEISPGPQLEISSFDFTGNTEFDSAQLAALCSTSVRRLFTPGSGRLVDETLRLDLANIKSFYALNGFDRAEIGPAEISERPGALSVSIPIREGRRRRIVDLDLSGAKSIEQEVLLGSFDLRPAGPFHEFLVEEARESIRAVYAERGYAATQVVTDYEWDDDRTLVDVSIKIDEGPKSVIDRVILRGNRQTDSAFIRRAMKVVPGEPLSVARTLEIQRNLYDLGIFSSVQVKPAPGTVFSSHRDLVVRVEEGRTRRILQGIGFDSEDGFRGLLGYSQSNLFGQAITGRIDIKASQKEEQVRALLRQPYLGRWEIPVTYSLFRVEEEKDAFESRRRGGQVDFQHFSENHRLGLLYTFKLVEVPAGDVPADQRELSESEISSITPSLLIDQRNDPLDPTAGWSSNFSLEYAFPLLSAETRFLKFFTQQTAYADLHRFGVLAGSLRLGLLEPLEVRSSHPGSVSRLSEVPISELFFAGGRTTHRAYRRDRLGVLGETLIVDGSSDSTGGQALVPLGGTGLVIANLDYRFPIVGALGGSVFADLGNVWADWKDFDSSEMKLGLGLGVRYRSPIGPLRLEVGWKVSREIGEDSHVVLLSFGNPF
jgi:outer membrane protein insertion porin family